MAFPSLPDDHRRILPGPDGFLLREGVVTDATTGWPLYARIGTMATRR
jgi:hypothetical protein